MASINKVILIGNLGLVSRDSLDDGGRLAFDAYIDALRHFSAAFEDLAASKFADTARRVSEALRHLRKLAGPFAIPKRIAAPWTATFNRTAAFFHAAKVDARNVP